MNFLRVCLITVAFGFGVMSSAAPAEEMLRPFVLAATETGNLKQVKGNVEAKLRAAGFSIVGTYSPYPEAELVIVTSDELKRTAAKTEFGAYGAAVRVGLTQTGGKVQVSYVNPTYMAAAYRMSGDLSGVSQKLKQTLGAERVFGYEEGFTVDDLGEYHYMFGLPYFDDPDLLGKFDSYEDAVRQIDSALESRVNGVGKVYRVDIPGARETVFGVSIAGGEGDDASVMRVVDKGDLRHTAHLPYELVVSGDRAYALNAQFRIAISFPELTMGTFMDISDSPNAIRDALTAVANSE